MSSPRVVGGQVEHALQLERRQLRMLPRIRAQMPAMCGVRSCSGRPDAPRRPRPRRRRRRGRRTRPAAPGCSRDPRIVFFVAADRDHRGEPPGVALDRHVVRGATTTRTPKIRLVGELVEVSANAARGRQAQVDDVEPLLDRPAQTRHQGLAEPVNPAPSTRTLGIGSRRKRADDPRTPFRGREVTLGVVLHDGLPSSPIRRRPAASTRRRADGRVDPAVEDADAHAAPVEPP